MGLVSGMDGTRMIIKQKRLGMTKYRMAGLCGLVLLNGCATIISGGTDQVAFSSIPEKVAFNIKDEQGKSVHQGTTPAAVVLNRGNGVFNGQSYRIDFSAPGYQSKTETLDASINGWYFGNLIFGGLLGLLIIDPATGAMWDLPETMGVNLLAN